MKMPWIICNSVMQHRHVESEEYHLREIRGLSPEGEMLGGWLLFWESYVIVLTDVF